MKAEEFRSLPIPETAITGWSHFNTGVFGGYHHFELDFQKELELNPFERIGKKAIEAFLKRHERVVAIDLGAMCGLTFTLYGFLFQKEITSGRLRLIATQLEENYTIENVILETQRRIGLQEFYEKLLTINRSELNSLEKHRLNTALFNTQLFLTPGELIFLEQNQHLVEFQTGIEIEQLTVNEPVHFAHEFNAGITFAHNQRIAANTVANNMSQDGIILSTIKWHTYNDSDAYRIWDSCGFSAKDLLIPTVSQRLTYTLFRKPDSPNI